MTASNQTYKPGDTVAVLFGGYERWPGVVARVTEHRVWVRRYAVRNGKVLGLNKRAEQFFPSEVESA